MIDRDTWEAVQAKFARRGTGPTPPRRDDLWLRGVLVCGGCGRPMHTSVQTGGAKGYICGSYYRYGQTRSEQFRTGCARNWVPHDQIERLVADHLEDVADDLEDPSEARGINAIMRDLLGVRHELTVVLRRAVTEYVRETCALLTQADGHRRFHRLLTRYTGRTVTDTDLVSELDKLADDSWDFTPKAARTLFVAFEEEKRELAVKRLAGLNREYEKWVLLWT